MVEAHIESGAGVTGGRHPGAAQGGRPVRRDQDRPTTASRIDEFLEKPADPPGLVDSPDESFASMGNYVFTADALVEALEKDAANAGLPARHGRRHHPDAGRRERGRASTTSSATTCRASTDRDRDYWRDVGTMDVVPRGAPGPGLGRADLQPLQHRLADLHLAPAAARRQVRRDRRRPTTRSSAPARSSPARPCDSSVIGTNVYVATGAVRRAQRDHGQRQDRPGRRAAQRDPRQERRGARRRRDRRRPRGRPQGAASP